MQTPVDAAEKKRKVEDSPPLPPPQEQPQHLKREVMEILGTDEEEWEACRKFMKIVLKKMDETHPETQIETQESQSSDSVEKDKQLKS